MHLLLSRPCAGFATEPAGEAQARLAAAEDGGQRLGKLMGDAGSHLTHGVDPHGMRKPGLVFVKARPLAGLPGRPALAQHKPCEKHPNPGDGGHKRSSDGRQELAESRLSGNLQKQWLGSAAERLFKDEVREGPTG
jgi:hypothetical protein